jgi:hypothetical protein
VSCDLCSDQPFRRSLFEVEGTYHGFCQVLPVKVCVDNIQMSVLSSVKRYFVHDLYARLADCYVSWGHGRGSTVF